MEALLTSEIIAAFLTLTALEIVLGIDNIIFISILTSRLPKHQQARGRTIGLALAMIMRIGLLFSLSWIMGLTEPLFELAGQEVSGRDLMLSIGGLFLIAKATREVHNALEGTAQAEASVETVGFYSVLLQIALIDIVFSFDSVITAVGLVQHIPVMVAAIVVAVGVMMIAAGPISAFVEDHPTIKMLALAFLVLIGMTLVAESLDFHVPKGYIYFAMAFAFGVELLNIRLSKTKRQAVKLRRAQMGDLIPDFLEEQDEPRDKG